MRPVPFLVGLLAGLLGCAVAGRIAASVTSFEYFNRFFIFIQPQTQFFPTMSQLLATAKLKTAPEKTLVVIGSSSIFRGTGQNPDDLWSRELQRLLGDDFAVLNYAIDQAAMTSFGAAAFRALRQIYPKVVFVALVDPWGSAPIDGDEPYRYLFWDGWYKGLLPPADEGERLVIADRRAEELLTKEGAAAHIAGILDRFFYFRDLWGTVAYKWASLVWTGPTSADPISARSTYVDRPAPNLREIQESHRADERLIATTVGGLEAAIERAQAKAEFWPALGRGYEAAFSPTLRGQVLAVRSRVNPQYVARLKSEMQTQYAAIEAGVCRVMADLGYSVLDVGADWSTDDYMDSGHLSAQGGRRLAAAVAVSVKAMASR